ncbi:hypothetical protein NG799_18940 [Laspinema sp. D1]|uniref:Uncharacterized protein n=1 Tax=Laspinema palackyanum D2a TaxID=2953684 RepID=A0ABT2MUK9_9CYAN|nr:hypothetical protein [Laspinema sp. D2a]
MENKTSNPTLRFLSRNRDAISKKDALGILCITTLGFQIVTLGILVVLYGAYSRLADRPAPSLVQLQTGEAIQVAAIDSKERTPEVIQSFVRETMSLLFTWTGELPQLPGEKANSSQPDSGMNIAKSGGPRRLVATPAWHASFALSHDFRNELLTQIADLTPPGVWRNRSSVVLEILELSPPQQIQEGEWKLTLVANLAFFDHNNALGEYTPFNKEIFVRAVEPPTSPLAETGIEAIISTIRQRGLEIYAIRDI